MVNGDDGIHGGGDGDDEGDDHRNGDGQVRVLMVLVLSVDE